MVVHRFVDRRQSPSVESSDRPPTSRFVWENQSRILQYNYLYGSKSEDAKCRLLGTVMRYHQSEKVNQAFNDSVIVTDRRIDMFRCKFPTGYALQTSSEGMD